VPTADTAAAATAPEKPDILSLLRDEAVSLGESLLPTAEETRSIVGALAQRLARFEKQVLGELTPAPTPAAPVAPVDPAAPAAPAAPAPSLDQQLADAQAQVAALEAEKAAAPPAP
jgi:hypothetical protein